MSSATYMRYVVCRQILRKRRHNFNDWKVKSHLWYAYRRLSPSPNYICFLNVKKSHVDERDSGLGFDRQLFCLRRSRNILGLYRLLIHMCMYVRITPYWYMHFLHCNIMLIQAILLTIASGLEHGVVKQALQVQCSIKTYVYNLCKTLDHRDQRMHYVLRTRTILLYVESPSP